MARAVPTNGELIERLRDQKGLTQEELAEKAGVSVKTLQSMEKGQKCLKTKISDVALTLGVEYGDLLVDEELESIPGQATCNSLLINNAINNAPVDLVDVPIIIQIPRSKWTQELQDSLVEAVEKITGQKGRVYVALVEDGSVKVTLRMSREDAERLQEAFLDGRFTELNGISLTVGKPVAVERTPPTSGGLWRWVTASRALSAASILCACSGAIPIEALPVYFLGLLLGLVALGIQIKRRSLLWLPVVAVILNAFAVLAWPNVIGVFRDANGYHFRAGERVRYGEVQFVLDDGFPEEKTYSVTVTEGAVGSADPSYTVEFTGRTSPTLRIKSGRYNIWLYTDSGHLVPVANSDDLLNKYVWPDFYGSTVIEMRSNASTLRSIKLNNK